MFMPELHRVGAGSFQQQLQRHQQLNQSRLHLSSLGYPVPITHHTCNGKQHTQRNNHCRN